MSVWQGHFFNADIKSLQMLSYVLTFEWFEARGRPKIAKKA